MTPGGDTTIAAYARAIEREWVAFVGGAVILSPRDWALISKWHARGIPLEIVREAIEAARERGKKRPRRTPPRGLGYIATAVDEGWTAVEDGRVLETALPEGPSDEPAETLSGVSPGLAERLRRRLESEAEGSKLSSVLLRSIRRLEQGDTEKVVESALDEELPAALPERWLRDAESEVERRIAPFEGRMSADAFESTRRRATLERLRRRVGLPRED